MTKEPKYTGWEWYGHRTLFTIAIVAITGTAIEKLLGVHEGTIAFGSGIFAGMIIGSNTSKRITP